MEFKEKRLFESEQKLLGILLNDGSLFEEVKLNYKHFTRREHQELFKGLVELKESGKEVDLFYLEDLGESRLMAMGGIPYVRELFKDAPPSDTMQRYEKFIKDSLTIKQAEQYTKAFLENIRETNDISQLGSFIDHINRLEGSTVEERKSFKDLLFERTAEHSESPQYGLSGIDTGFDVFNKATDGWQDTDLIVIGARPSMGKTAFLLNTILEGSKKEDAFYTFFSIEMSKGAVIDRLIATEGKIEVRKMRNTNKYFRDNDSEKYSGATGRLESLNLDIRKESTVQEMRSIVRKNIKENPDKNHLVAIDFLTMIRSTRPNPNRTQEIEEIILDLKKLAEDLEVPVIVLSQLSRALEQRQDKRPMMSDLRESGAIEQTADTIIFLYRDNYYKPENAQPNQKEEVEFLITKNRNGPVGKVKLDFYKEINKFYNQYST